MNDVEIELALPHGGPAGTKRLAIRTAPKALPYLLQGHPWLFEDSILRISGEGPAGNVCVLFDRDGKKVLGAGLYDPHSPVRVKVLAHGAGRPPVGRELFDALCRESRERRAGQVPEKTTAWRLIHGDSDSIPGLAADRYGTMLVMKFYTTALLPWSGDLAGAVFRQYPELNALTVRLSRELQRLPEAERCGLEDGMMFPPQTPQIRFQENGITFEADVRNGQKTGFFLDQRDNRKRVEELSNGGRILNVFSFSGGFSLYAARGGAKEVVSVDFDKHAIAACDAHFAMNSGNPAIAACKHTGIAGDAFAVMEDLRKKKQVFDVVIVDPPSFAKASAETGTALHSYCRLAKAAVQLIRHGGILVFASCSSRVTADELFTAVKETAAGTGRPLEEIERDFHAFDHPAKFKESKYLKCLYARVK